MTGVSTPSAFGQLLRFWRKTRGMSQLSLALTADTTPRHVSFIETGRSRPGAAMIVRLAEALDIPVGERNALLISAGHAVVYPDTPLDDSQLKPFVQAVDAILERHSPYPGCALNLFGEVKMANAACRALWPGVMGCSSEDAIDRFYGDGARHLMDNWAEVAWAGLDRMRHDARRTQSPRLQALVDRALEHLRDVPRPPPHSDGSPIVCPRFRVGDTLIETFSTVMRFETARDVTMSELKVELIFPVDAAGDAFFRGLTA